MANKKTVSNEIITKRKVWVRHAKNSEGEEVGFISYERPMFKEGERIKVRVNVSKLKASPYETPEKNGRYEMTASKGFSIPVFDKTETFTIKNGENAGQEGSRDVYKQFPYGTVTFERISQLDDEDFDDEDNDDLPF